MMSKKCILIVIAVFLSQISCKMEDRISFEDIEFVIIDRKCYESEMIDLITSLTANEDGAIRLIADSILENIGDKRSCFLSMVKENFFIRRYAANELPPQYFFSDSSVSIELSSYKSTLWQMQQIRQGGYFDLDEGEKQEVLFRILNYSCSATWRDGFYLKNKIRFSMEFGRLLAEIKEELYDLDYLHFKSGNTFVQPFYLFKKLDMAMWTYPESEDNFPYYNMSALYADRLLEKLKKSSSEITQFYTEELNFWKKNLEKVKTGEVMIIILT